MADSTNPAAAVAAAVATPAAATTPAAAAAPQNTSQTGNANNSYQATAASNFDANILGNYNAPTYHIKFYALAEQFGGTSTSTVVSGTATSVVIAESGVTGYNIKSLQLQSKVMGDQTNRNTTMTALTMVINEPNGTSFLDALFAVTQGLGISNPQKSPYYLDVSFKGYNEDGTLNTNLCSNFPNNGLWTYTIILGEIEAELSAQGSTYTIQAKLTETEGLKAEISRMNVAMNVSGYTTFGGFLDSLASVLNQRAKTSYALSTSTATATQQASLYTYSFNTIATPNGIDPRSFTYANQDDALNSFRAKGFLQGDKANNVHNLQPGDNIADVITAALGATVQGPAYAINATGDTSKGDLGDGSYRCAGIFKVYPTITPIGYDTVHGNYVLNVVYNIKMYKSQNTTLRTAETQNATANGPSAIADVQSYNGLRKRYDYLFTGLNSEVLEFNTRFNFNYNAEIPANFGFQSGQETLEHHASYNPNLSQSAIQQQITADQTIDATAAVQAQSVVTNGQAITGQSIGGGANANGLISSSTVYAEDLLNTATNSNPFIVSVQQGGAHQKQNAGVGVIGRFDRRRSIFGSIIQQNNASTSFNDISLKIKGDPFWLGTSQDIALGQSSVANSSASNTNSSTATSALTGGAVLPDYTAGDNTFIILFRYPYTTDESGAPIMKDDDTFSGVYTAQFVQHDFENGIFTQTLKGKRLMNVTPGLAQQTAKQTSTTTTTPTTTQ